MNVLPGTLLLLLSSFIILLFLHVYYMCVLLITLNIEKV